MPTETLSAEPANEATEPLPPLALEVGSKPESGWQATLWEGFVRLWVVAAGIALGAILALFIGLFSGWIPIC